MENKIREVNERKYMEVDIYDTDGDGFIDVCTMALSLIDSETGDTLDVTTIKKQLEKLETLIKSSDTTSKDSEKLIKDLKTLQDKVENVERTLDSKIVSNKIEQTEQIEQVKNLIINIQNIINMKADKVHMHNEYANKTHTHSYNDLTDKPIINNNPKVNIIDNLDSTATTSALSANQGKVLNGTIKEVKTSLSNVENNIKNIDLSADKVKLSGITGIQSNDVRGAIQELFTNADNAQKQISSIIGSPLSAGDTLQTQKNKIEELKKDMVRNLKKSGEECTANDSFESLISKINNNKFIEMDKVSSNADIDPSKPMEIYDIFQGDIYMKISNDIGRIYDSKFNIIKEIKNRYLVGICRNGFVLFKNKAVQFYNFKNELLREIKVQGDVESAIFDKDGFSIISFKYIHPAQPIKFNYVEAYYKSNNYGSVEDNSNYQSNLFMNSNGTILVKCSEAEKEYIYILNKNRNSEDSFEKIDFNNNILNTMIIANNCI